jgi:hypothetical protein
MSTTKLTERENGAMCAYWLGHGGPKNKENQVKMNLSTVLGTLPLRNGKDPDQIVGSGFVSKWKVGEKQGPDPYQNGLDPQHCLFLPFLPFLVHISCLLPRTTRRKGVRIL